MRPSYRKACDWIALNDEPDEWDEQKLAELVSVVLIADLFGKQPIDVAREVLKYRDEGDRP